MDSAPPLPLTHQMTAGSVTPAVLAKPTAATRTDIAAADLSQPHNSFTAVHIALAQPGNTYPPHLTSLSSSSSPPTTSRSSSSSSSASISSASSSAVRVQSLLCPVHPVCQPRPLSCSHCMRTSTALTSYPSVPPSSSLPFVTAAQITSHWSSRFVEHQLPSIPAAAQHYSANVLPATSASYFSYLHSATSASLLFPSTASSTHSTSYSHSQSHCTTYSPTLLPSLAIKQPPLTVRRKQHFSVDAQQCSQSYSGSESSSELAILTQQLSAARQQRRQRGLSRRDDSSSTEQSTSDSEGGAAGGRKSDRRRTVSVERVSEQRESGTEMEDDDHCDVSADDELTSLSIERADECELSVCQKTRQLNSAVAEEKTSEDDVAYHSVTPGVQFVTESTDGW